MMIKIIRELNSESASLLSDSEIQGISDFSTPAGD